MRTKALILAAAVSAMGVASSMAQVYSVNAVGYINVTVPGNNSLKIIANQLNGSGTTIGALIPTAPDGFQLFNLLPNGTFQIGTFAFGAWDDATLPLVPGGALFALNPDPAPFTITFVGEVPQGTLNNTIPNGLSLKSSIVPQAGLLQTALGFNPGEGDQVFQYNTGTGLFDIGTFAFGAWDTEPNLAVGEGFYIFTSTPQTWTRMFSVN